MSSPTEQAQGLGQRYTVRRVDGRDGPGEKHDGCDYFVLDLTHDEMARQAFLHYARLVRRDQPELWADAITLMQHQGDEVQRRVREIRTEVDCDPPLSWDPEDVAWAPTPPGYGDDGSAPLREEPVALCDLCSKPTHTGGCWWEDRHFCAETGQPVEFRAPDDDYRTDCRWRYANDAVCHHRIARAAE